MILSSIEKMASGIGYDIGCSSDVVQADLVNGFCKGLYNSIPQSSQRDIQYCYIAEKLDTKTLEVLKALVEFIELK